MKVTVLGTCVAALCAGGVDALYLTKKDAPPAVISLPLQFKTIAAPSGDGLWRRDKATTRPLNAKLIGNVFGYTTTIGVGKKNTPIQVLIDTGSSDTILQTGKSQHCQENGGCVRYGTVDPTWGSLTLVKAGAIRISYVGGKVAVADLVKDVIRIGGQPVPDALFGVAVATNFEFNVLGLGYAANEAVADGNTYLNLPQMMKEKGLIKNVVYSLFLNSQKAGSGSILFGGIDTGKIKGKLKTLTVQGDRREIVIGVSGISFGAEKGSSFNAVVDTGSTRISLADELVWRIWDWAGIRLVDDYGEPIRSCKLSDAESKMALVLSFGATKIQVPMAELVIPESTEPGNFKPLDPGLCYFGVFGSGKAISVLGMPFLRSAYVVVNLDRNEVSLAPANFNGGSKIIEIPDGGVPSLGKLAAGVDDGTLDAENFDFNTLGTLNEQIPADGSNGTSETVETWLASHSASNADSNTLLPQVSTNPDGSTNTYPLADGATQIGSTTLSDGSLFNSGGSSDPYNLFLSPNVPGAGIQQPNQGTSQIASGDGSMDSDSLTPVESPANSDTQLLSQLDTTNWLTPTPGTVDFQQFQAPGGEGGTTAMNNNKDSLLPTLAATGNDGETLALFAPDGSNGYFSSR